MLHTCPAQFHKSIINRFWQCWGWSNHSWCRGSTATTTTTNTTTTTTTTTSSSAKLTPGPARHELTHLRTLILGEVGLATMQDHGRAQWLWLLSWHDSIHLSDRHHLVFLLIQSLLVSLDFFHDMMEWGDPITWDLLVQISEFFLKTSNTGYFQEQAQNRLWCSAERLCWWVDSWITLGEENSWSPLHRAAEDLLAPGHFWSVWPISLPWVASMLIISNCCILLFRLLIFSFCMVIRNWLIPGLLPSCCHLLDSLRFGLGFRLQLHQVLSGFSSLCSWLLPFELSLAKK